MIYPCAWTEEGPWCFQLIDGQHDETVQRILNEEQDPPDIMARFLPLTLLKANGVQVTVKDLSTITYRTKRQLLDELWGYNITGKPLPDPASG